MKKLICILLSLVLVLSLASCANTGNDETTEPETVAKPDAPVVSLLTESTEVNAGDSVSVVLHIKDGINTACFDIFVFAEGKIEYVGEKKAKGLDSSLILAANYMTEEDPAYVALRGIVASTCNIADNDVYSFEYKVSDDAVSGDKISVVAQIPMYQVGTDETGNEVYAVNEYIEINNLVLTVK